MNAAIILQEITYKAVRSSGPGGQHVNKVATKIELVFDLKNSEALSEKQKDLLFLKLKNKLTKDGFLIITCQESRSQHKNKDLVTQKLLSILKDNLVVAKKRKPTKPSKSSIKKRLSVKKLISNKKNNRKKPSID